MDYIELCEMVLIHSKPHATARRCQSRTCFNMQPQTLSSVHTSTQNPSPSRMDLLAPLMKRFLLRNCTCGLLETLAYIRCEIGLDKQTKWLTLQLRNKPIFFPHMCAFSRFYISSLIYRIMNKLKFMMLRVNTHKRIFKNADLYSSPYMWP